MMRTQSLVIVSVCAFVSGGLARDSPPVQAYESRLFGVELVSASLKGIVRVLGPPTRKDETLYCWAKPGYEFCAEVLRDATFVGGERVLSLSLERRPTGAPPVQGTGRGLRLGETLARAEQLYGHGFGRLTDGLIGYEYPLRGHGSLRIEVDPRGRVRLLTLIGPE